MQSRKLIHCVSAGHPSQRAKVRGLVDTLNCLEDVQINGFFLKKISLELHQETFFSLFRPK